LFYVITSTGSSYNPNTNPPSATATYTPNSIPDQYLIGNARIIGKAFEVHNTTADLYRQGMATTWSQPVGDYNTAGTYYSSLNTSGSFSHNTYASLYQVPLWPTSQSASVLIPGSRQWTADQGAYIVSRFETTNIPVSECGFPIQPFLNGGDSSNTTLNLAPLPTASSINTSNYTWDNTFWDSSDMRGVLFSGLSLQTTLTVNVMWIIERQPDTTISDLVVLTKPPPERDNVALDLYTHISDHLPSGCPVAENGLGDWFMDALSTAADFVSPVISALPGVGGAIGKGINAVNSAYKSSKVKSTPSVVVEPVFETNPYVKPASTTVFTNKKGKTMFGLGPGGSKDYRVDKRQFQAELAHAKRLANARKGKKEVVNPFKGKSIPR